MTRTPAAIRRLIERKETLQLEVEKLKARIDEIDETVSLLETQDTSINVKSFLIELLRDAGDLGLTVNEVIRVAAEKNVTLNKGSVSVTLSKFKREGLVDYQDRRYSLK